MKKIEIKVPSPLGPSVKGRGFGKHWNNILSGTCGPVICGICGTKHPENTDESYIISMFLGKEVVEKCCGAILDQVYVESGEEFAQTFIEEFSENPTGTRFFGFGRFLIDKLRKAKSTLRGIEGETDKALKAAAELKKIMPK